MFDTNCILEQWTIFILQKIETFTLIFEGFNFSVTVSWKYVYSDAMEASYTKKQPSNSRLAKSFPRPKNPMRSGV